MDPRLLGYYNSELAFMREMGAEFAHEFPKIAGRLGLEGLECADPYTERLLEGFAFLAARVHLRLDSEFPRFTQRLLEVTLPHYLAPIPAGAVVQFKPDLREDSLADGVKVPRGTNLRGVLGKDEQTSCQFVTAHNLELTPLTLTEADYLPTPASITTLGVPAVAQMRSAIRLRFELPAGTKGNALKFDNLPLFIPASDRFSARLHELIASSTVGLVVRSGERGALRHQQMPATHLRPLGLTDDEAMLPVGPRTFQGYRLLQEYFLLPERFQFLNIGPLGPALSRVDGEWFELFLICGRGESLLENALSPNHFALHCTPAINLFERDCDRIHISNRDHEHHVLPDRTRPMDFEVYQVQEAAGLGSASEQRQQFAPFYSSHDVAYLADDKAYFMTNRLPRRHSEKQQRVGARSSYIGSEVYVSIVDSKEAPYRADLDQLAVRALCTNRDLPLHMPVGRGNTDFTVDIGLPIESVRCLLGPTKPRPAWPEGQTAWRLVSHLSLNYLSLIDSDPARGAESLREILALYGDIAESHVQKQIEGIRHVNAETVTRRMPVPGPIAFGRGLEITLSLEDSAFEGGNPYLLASVLEQFFARYASMNSFTQTVLRSTERGEIMRWPVRSGRLTRL